MRKGFQTLGSRGVVSPGLVLLGLPGMGICFIVACTSLPESIERLKIRITRPRPARRRKIRRFPRSKATIAPEA